MGKLEEIRNKTAEIKEDGDKIIETGEGKLQEGEAFKGALDGLDAFDEDARAIIDNATEGAREVAVEQAETAVKAPMDSVNDSLSEVATEADTYSKIEETNAGKISGTSGDYDAVSGQAENSFEQHAAELEESGDSAQAMNNEFREQADNLTNQIESLF